jgi:glycosyltransferase involved in cell wall biosynthesis
MNQLAIAAFNFLLNLWLIPRFGWKGAAWASLMSDGALGLMNWLVLRYVLRKRRDQRGSAAPQTPEHSPKVSVVIPYFKQQKYLRETVESVKALQHADVEIVVIDDGSPIPASMVLSGIDGVTVLRTENRGVSAARNFGVSQTTGDYLIFLDADDLLEPDVVQSHLAALRRDPEAVMSFGAVRIIDEKGRELVRPHVCRPRRSYLRPMLVSNPVACPGTAMISRAAFYRAGAFDESFSKAEDFLLFLRIAVREKIVRNARCTVSYRSHPQGISLNKPAMLAGTLAALDAIEGELNAKDRRFLEHARRRWRHAYEEKSGLGYMLKELYFKLHAMMTVPPSAYFRHESAE